MHISHVDCSIYDAAKRTAMKIISIDVAKSAVYHGTILSTSRPTRGDSMTPTAPTSPNSPIYVSVSILLAKNDLG